MRGFVRSLTGRAERDVVAALVAQVQAAADGTRLAIEVCAGHWTTGDGRAAMGDIEHDGDERRRRAVEILTRSLVTPIDREDMFRLSRSIDDVLDNLRDFTREYDLYSWGPDPVLADVHEGIAEGIESLREAVGSLTGGAGAVRRTALGARKNDIRQRYQTAMRAVLDEPLSSETLKRRELLRRLDVVGLRIREAADALADGAVKRSH
jgi:uncharacterized protein Yka (UPF0111/DUF47 family)